jgi:calcineurin-like phosphoesterase family protein
MIFFTSDTHFGHKNIIKFSNRPFYSIEEMDEVLIQNWNNVVGKNDTIYHLGDFCFGNSKKYLKRLNGNIIRIKGSHDRDMKSPYMKIIQPKGLLDQYGNQRSIVLCHYSMRTWHLSHYASWHLWGHSFDKKTEVLSNNGWKNVDNIYKNDKIVTLNLNNNVLEYNDIDQIIKYRYTGQIIKIKSKGLDLNITPDHVLIEPMVWRNSLKYRKYFAKDVDNLKKRFFVQSGVLKQKGIGFDDDTLRLLVWIAADGSLYNSTLVRVQLYKERKIERLEKLLNSLNIDYRKYPTKAGGYYLNFTEPENIRHLRLKPLAKCLEECNQHQAEVVLEEYSHTDGSSYGDTIVIWTSKKSECDILQTMCILNGIQCNVSKRVGHGFAKKPNYVLFATKKQFRAVSQISQRVSIDTVKNELYWCLKVKNQTLMIRRNGKPCIVGNSHGKLESYGLSFDVGVDTNDFYPYSLDDVENKMKTLKPIVDFRKGL